MYILLFLSIIFGGNTEFQNTHFEVSTDSIPNYIAINDTISIDTITNDTLYKIVAEMPRFSECANMESISEKVKCSDREMMLYVLRKVKVPKGMDMSQILSDKIVVSMIIDKEGNIRNSKVIKSIHPDFDAAFLKMLEGMPIWISGKHNGQNVKVQINLPMDFRF
jgi:hypothetical protein